MPRNRQSEDEYAYFVAETDGSLHLAWQRLLTSSILDTKDRLGLKIFSAGTAVHIENIRQDLCHDAYVPGDPFFTYTPKDDKMMRIRTFLDMRDRLVYQALGNIIIDNCYDDLVSHANETIFAHIPSPNNRDGTPSNFTFRLTFPKENMRSQYDRFLDAVFSDNKKTSTKPDFWMLKTDIAAFYPSIDHALLREMLLRRGWLKNTTLIDLLMRCLKRWSTLDESTPSGQGVPVGYETSEILATLYLFDIDLRAAHRYPRPYRMRRFVDDTYIFMQGRENLTDFLVMYDLDLQQRALTRNRGKTEIRPCSSDFTRATVARELRGKLSYVKHLQYIQEDVIAQDELWEIFTTEVNCDGSCDEDDVKRLHEQASTISFVLGRLKIIDERAKNIALCVLDELPSKSYNATTYLSQFNDDPKVLEKLFQVIERGFGYSSCRIDCMKAIIEILGVVDERLRETLFDWMLDFNQYEWQLRDAAIDALRDFSQEDVVPALIEASRNDPSYLIRAKAIFRCFDLLENVDDRIELINQALEDTSYTVQSLGIYLYRRAAGIPHNRLLTRNLQESLEGLIYSTEVIADFENFSRLFEDVFDFEITPSNTLLVRRIPNIERANQLLLNLQDANSDRVDFVKALHDFALQFFTAYARTINSQFFGITLRDILTTIHSTGDEYTTLSKLRDLNEDAQTGNHSHIKHTAKEHIFNQIKMLIASDLISYYAKQGIATPIKLHGFTSQHTISRTEPMRDKVFISYSHKDAKWRDMLRSHLRPLEQYGQLNVWVDTEIRVGDKWKIEIENALSTAKVAVLLVTREFLASDFINSRELPEFLKAAAQDGLKIIWVAVSASNWYFSPLNDYQCANDPENPLDTLSDGEQNQIFVDICKKIYGVITP